MFLSMCYYYDSHMFPNCPSELPYPVVGGVEHVHEVDEQVAITVGSRQAHVIGCPRRALTDHVGCRGRRGQWLTDGHVLLRHAVQQAVVTQGGQSLQ